MAAPGPRLPLREDFGNSPKLPLSLLLALPQAPAVPGLATVTFGRTEKYQFFFFFFSLFRAAPAAYGGSQARG